MVHNIHNFPYKNILVFGLSKTGLNVSEVLKQEGFNILVTDLLTKETDDAVKKLKKLAVPVYLGDVSLSILNDIEVIIKNPGIPYHVPLIEEAAKRGIPVMTEIELLAYMRLFRTIAITGSNGKTTTTTLVESMLRKSEIKAVAAGNIGRVATKAAYTLAEDETLVLELSSFQLMGIKTFAPNISVLLNFASAHLDYHGDIESYHRAKMNICEHQNAADFIVYNYDDATISAAIATKKAKKIPFSTTQRLNTGGYINAGGLYYNDELIIDLKDIKLVGTHNLENILASVISARLCGATVASIRDVLMTFAGVKHRLQFVDKKRGVAFYNDSKATNILATITALKAFTEPVRLICGGLDRGNDFDDLVPYLKHVEGLYVYGQTKEKLAATGKKANVLTIKKGDSLEEMTKEAAKDATSASVILLSPACASWDQFENFEVRGDIFIQTVHTL